MNTAPQDNGLALAGAPNFRDLGGYTGAGGRSVRRGRLFRSDHLAHLGPDDLARLARHLGPAPRVIDLRGATERESAACAIAGATVHSLPIEPTIVQRLTSLLEAGQSLTPADTVALMQETYRNFVHHNTPRFAALVAHVLEDAPHPLVFHCTAGKDRTGFAAALLLHALGVPQQTVMHDYLLTNQRYPVPPASRHGLPPEVLQVLWQVQPAFLLAAYEAVERDHGGMQAYLREGLGLGPSEQRRLHEMLLV